MKFTWYEIKTKKDGKIATTITGEFPATSEGILSVTTKCITDFNAIQISQILDRQLTQDHEFELLMRVISEYVDVTTLNKIFSEYYDLLYLKKNT